MIAHPVDTIKGVGHAIAHPVTTAKALGHAVAETGKGVLHGDGRSIGTAVGSVGMFFVPGADVAEGAEDVARLDLLGEAGANASKVGEASDAAKVTDGADVGKAADAAPAEAAQGAEIAPGGEPGPARTDSAIPPKQPLPATELPANPMICFIKATRKPAIPMLPQAEGARLLMKKLATPLSSIKLSPADQVMQARITIIESTPKPAAN